MRIFSLVFLCSLLLITTLRASAPEEPSTKDRVLGAMNAAEQGEIVFNTTCALCHGHSGSGGQGRPLQNRSFDPDRWFSTISKGRTRGSKRMPAFENSLSEEQRWQVIAYLISISGK